MTEFIKANHPQQKKHGAGPEPLLTDPLRYPETLEEKPRLHRALLLVLANLFVPGTAQLVAGDRKLARRYLRVTVMLWLVVAIVIVLALTNRELLINIFAITAVQWAVIIGLLALALWWFTVQLNTFRLLKLKLLTPGHRRITVAVTLLTLVATVGVPLYGAYVVNSGRTVLGNVFDRGPAIEPAEGRYNFLLLGADAGEGREGLRPDSISVVSVNAGTGQSVIFSIPRDFQNTPFPADSPLHQVYPNGFSCGDACIINALYTDVMNNYPDIYPDDVKDPGAQAMVDAASGILGLEVQGYAMIDMDGFSELIDALGGVNVTTEGWTTYRGLQPDGVWGNAWWGPGEHHFNGDDALAFARSRTYSSDYNRVRRQQCIQQAMIQQFTPQNVLLNFTDLMSAGERVVETDLPQNQLGSFVSLAEKARSQPIAKLTLGPPDFGTAADRFSTYPDFTLIHERVNEMFAAEQEEPSAAALTDSAANTQNQPVSSPVYGFSKPSGVLNLFLTQPDGSPITEEYLVQMERIGYTSILEQVSEDNYKCQPGN